MIMAPGTCGTAEAVLFKSHCPGVLVDYATERIFRHAVPQAQTSGSARALSARAFKPKQGGRLLVKKRSFWRFLRKPLKPFEDRCPRIEASWPRLISGVSTC